MNPKIQNLVDLIKETLITQIVSIDKDRKVVLLRDSYFLRNIIETYYSLHGYEVKYVD